jgi:hypothetical protein
MIADKRNSKNRGPIKDGESERHALGRLPEREIQRELQRQFWQYVKNDDETGYWKWVTRLSGYDPDSDEFRDWASQAWKSAVSEYRSGARHQR